MTSGRKRFVKQDAKNINYKEKDNIFNYIKLQNMSEATIKKVRRPATY